jgi:hypothetical protein
MTRPDVMGGHGALMLVSCICVAVVSGCSAENGYRACGANLPCDEPRFTVEWVPEANRDSADEARLSRVAEHASSATILRQLNVGTEPIKFTIVSELPESDAVTLVEERRIVIGRDWIVKSDPPLEALVTHELTHLAIGQIPGYQRIPLWLQEGVAEMAAGRTGCRMSQELGALHSLGYSVTAALHDSSGAATAIHYKVYGSFSVFIINAAQANITRLLAEIARHGLDVGLKRATGRAVDLLEQQWLAELERRQHESTCE